MRIWKCDMCGTILENGEDVMAITCKDCSDKVSYPNSYEVCRECAKKVVKTIYDYCMSQEKCDNCLLNAEHEYGDIRCMVGFPEDNWAKSYPDLKKERNGND